jgi:DNA-binding NtrC family response regulator
LPRPGILIVDDDATLLDLLRIICIRQGFEVWSTSSGAAAVDLYRRHQEHIALALLDVRMPKMDGPQVLAELRQVNPGVRACFMSGFTGGTSPEELLSCGALKLFEKPFQVPALGEDLWRLAQAETRRSA